MFLERCLLVPVKWKFLHASEICGRLFTPQHVKLRRKGRSGANINSNNFLPDYVMSYCFALCFLTNHSMKRFSLCRYSTSWDFLCNRWVEKWCVAELIYLSAFEEAISLFSLDLLSLESNIAFNKFVISYADIKSAL